MFTFLNTGCHNNGKHFHLKMTLLLPINIENNSMNSLHNQFYIKIYRNPKTFFKISFPPPPRVPAKDFACICVTIFYTLYESGLLAQGGERCSAAQKLRA